MPSMLATSAEPMRVKAESLHAKGQTVMYVAMDGKFVGLIAVADPIKSTTAEAIERLKKEGIKVVMVTGDNHTTAEAVAKKLAIDFEADVLPEKRQKSSKSCKTAEPLSPWPATE